MFMTVVFVSGLLIFGLVLLMFPNLRTLLKGFGNLFVKDMAATPEGVRAIYEEKIDEAQDRYKKACEHLELVAGKLKMITDDITKSKRDSDTYRSKAISAKNAKNEEDAIMYAEQMALSDSRIEALTVTQEALEKAKLEAIDMHRASEITLKDIKNKKEIAIQKIESNQSLKEIYAGLDELRRDSSLDKLIGHVDDKIKKDDEQIAGMKVLHDNKLTTKLGKADERHSKARAMDFLNSLDTKNTK